MVEKWVAKSVISVKTADGTYEVRLPGDRVPEAIGWKNPEYWCVLEDSPQSIHIEDARANIVRGIENKNPANNFLAPKKPTKKKKG